MNLRKVFCAGYDRGGHEDIPQRGILGPHWDKEGVHKGSWCLAFYVRSLTGQGEGSCRKNVHYRESELNGGEEGNYAGTGFVKIITILRIIESTFSLSEKGARDT